MAERELRRNYLSLIEVIALSVSIIAPTMAMSFNTSLTASVAGAAVPLVFLVSTIAMLLVGVSFLEFSKRIPHAGSVYAYNAKGLGPKVGFVSGWALTGTYFAYAAGTAALFGNFANVFLQHFGVNVPSWILVLIAMAAVWFFSYRDIRLSTRTALSLELISIAVLLVLSFIIIGKGGAEGHSFAPFSLSAGGISGVGMGIIYGILSFAGFEGAATLGEEAQNPKRAVPFAIFGTVIAAGIFFTLVSYAQVIGFGSHHIDQLQKASAPLDLLATTYAGKAMGIFIDFAAMISAFACSLGSANACSRMLFALGRDGTLPQALGRIHEAHRTPHISVHVICALMVVAYLVIGLVAGPTNFYNYFGTLGTLTLLVAYLLINLSAVCYFQRNRDTSYSVVRHIIIPIVGLLILLWPVYGNLYPIPPYPFNLFPYIAAAWIVLGVVLIVRATRRDPSIADRVFTNLESIGG